MVYNFACIVRGDALNTFLWIKVISERGHQIIDKQKYFFISTVLRDIKVHAQCLSWMIIYIFCARGKYKVELAQ